MMIQMMKSQKKTKKKQAKNKKSNNFWVQMENHKSVNNNEI